MPMPTNVPIIDTMIGIPRPDKKRNYDFMKALFMDRESKEQFDFPVEYMFKDVPKTAKQSDYVKYTLDKMDTFNIERGMIAVTADDETTQRALKDHPDRFFGCVGADPNEGMEAVYKIVSAYEQFGIKAVTIFPCGTVPQVPINDKKFYPIYAKCVELDIPIFCCAGVPGPRIPMAPQKVELVDEVMWFFPELKFVFRHGTEPWDALAVKLMLKWPGLYYSTSAFAPKHYPKSIIDYANSRGADKVIYAGYFPMGLTLERIMGDMPKVPFKDEVWPKFLRENAMKVLKLDA
jgi:predicted TIM-barrel fold metal-dependent hydrolase